MLVARPLPASLQHPHDKISRCPPRHGSSHRTCPLTAPQLPPVAATLSMPTSTISGTTAAPCRWASRPTIPTLAAFALALRARATQHSRYALVKILQFTHFSVRYISYSLKTNKYPLYIIWHLYVNSKYIYNAWILCSSPR